MFSESSVSESQRSTVENWTVYTGLRAHVWTTKAKGLPTCQSAQLIPYFFRVISVGRGLGKKGLISRVKDSLTILLQRNKQTHPVPHDPRLRPGRVFHHLGRVYI